MKIPISPWQRYLANAAHMRLIVQQNQEDYLFERITKGRIVYLFDANIIHLFLNPSNSLREMLAFGDPKKREDRLATAMITAEFMFSKTLSGQNGIPAYVAPGHADDLNNMLAAIEREVNRNAQADFARVEDKVEAITRIVHDVRAGAISDIAALQQLTNAFPPLAKALFDGAPFEARQFSRLINDDLIRPLELLPEATREVLFPDIRLVNSWVTKIRDALTSPRDEENIKRDAKTMVQLLLLNEAAAGEEVEPVRYVLVTADEALLRAYARFFTENRFSRSQDFVLRQPAQFLPILNPEQMSHGRLRSELVRNLREVFDSLFPFQDLDDNSYARLMWAIADPKLANFEDGDPVGGIFAAFLATDRRKSLDALEAVRKQWAEAGRTAVVLNSSWLKAHFREGWDAATEVIHHTHGMERGILDHLANLLHKVESAHASFVAEGFLQRTEPELYPTPSLLMRSADEEISGILTAQSNARLPTAPPVHKWKAQKTPGLDRLILTWAACIAYRSRQWSACAQYARRAQTLLLRDEDSRVDAATLLEEDRHELYYLECAASRRVLDEDNFERCRLQLLQSISYYDEAKDGFGLGRTHLELSHLELAYYLRTNSEAARGSLKQLALKHFFEALDHISHALSSAENVTGSHPTGPKLVSLVLQLRVVLCALDDIMVHVEAFDTAEIIRSCDLVEQFARASGVPLAPPVELAVDYCRANATHQTQRHARARANRDVSHHEPPSDPLEREITVQLQHGLRHI